MKSRAEQIAEAAYHRVLEEAAIAGEATTVADLRERVAEELLGAYQNGLIDQAVINQEWADTVARGIDAAQTRAGRDVLNEIATGQTVMSALLDAVFATGEGGRVLGRYVNAQTWVAIDRGAIENMNRVTARYAITRNQVWEPILDKLLRNGGTLGDLGAAGILEAVA